MVSCFSRDGMLALRPATSIVLSRVSRRPAPSVTLAAERSRWKSSTGFPLLTTKSLPSDPGSSNETYWPSFVREALRYPAGVSSNLADEVVITTALPVTLTLMPERAAEGGEWRPQLATRRLRHNSTAGRTEKRARRLQGVMVRTSSALRPAFATPG